MTAAMLVLFMLIMTSCGRDVKTGTPGTADPSRNNPQIEEISEQERLLLHYILSQHAGEYGLYTNRIDTSQSEEQATGHEVLSESAGLLMRYYAGIRDEAGFQEVWKTAKRTFDGERLFSYRYSPKLDKKYPVNAAIDDLRMIRALYEAAEAFGSAAYRKEADRYAERFYEYNVQEDRLLDFYDEGYGIANASITLCYIDLRTIGMLPIPKNKNQQLQSGMLKVIEEGYLSESFPFYQSRYHYKTSEYSSDNIHTIESLLTILHLAEEGRAKPASIAFIKKQVAAGTLFGQYTIDGEPANDIRSTAIYAIAALIGHELGDDDLYNSSLEKMELFQIIDPASPLYGGFGDPGSGQAYSFDNVMALLAFSAKRL